MSKSFIIFWFICLSSCFSLRAMVSDSCHVIVWKSGKSISARIISQNDSQIKYQKCNGEGSVYSVLLFDIKSIDNQLFASYQPDSCILLTWQNGRSDEVKILESHQKWVKFKFCHDSEQTEYVVIGDEIKSMSKKHDEIIAKADSCQIVRWKSGRYTSVVVVNRDDNQFRYYKCSDAQKHEYRAKFTELFAEEVPAYYRLGRKSLAIVALVLAVLPLPFSLTGFILGVIAANRKDGNDMAIAALVLGSLFAFTTIALLIFLF